VFLAEIWNMMSQRESYRNQRGGNFGGYSSKWKPLRTVEISLRPTWRSWLLLLFVVGTAVLVGGEDLRVAYVSILAESVEPVTLRHAIALDPLNPELHHRLGMALQDSPSDADRTESLKQLRLATELDPYTARYWSDLAWVCEFSGDTACETEGVLRAVKLRPMMPQVRWVAANSLLRAGQKEAAMDQFRRLLELDPSYAPQTFHLCLGSLGNPQLILENVVPRGKDPTLMLAYLNILSRSEMDGADELARQVWVETVGEGTAFPLASAAPYIEHLLSFGQVREAQSAWRDLETLGVIGSRGNIDPNNLVFNGDFESVPVNTGFDWRNPQTQYLALDFSDPTAHSGKSSLRVDFTVSRNEGYFALYQFVPVVPNQAYLLSAFVRSQDITSDSGPRLQVADPIHSTGPNVMSESTTGTTPWHQISLDFCTRADTTLLQISLMRVRGRTFPTEITGSFWLDSVSLKSSGPATPDACTSPE
jgi:hypothetical protein